MTGHSRLEIMNVAFTANVPHNAALGLELVLAEPGEVEIRMPWARELVGDPATGVIHGGALVSLIDATCGAAVFLAVVPPRPIATLDLRVEHLRRAEANKDVWCRASCERVTTHIAFVRAVAHQGDPANPCATARATFMIFREGQVIGDRPAAGGGR